MRSGVVGVGGGAVLAAVGLHAMEGIKSYELYVMFLAILKS